MMEKKENDPMQNSMNGDTAGSKSESHMGIGL